VSAQPETKMIWEAFPKQRQALERREFEILYGGARGGGKTDAGMVWLLYDIDNPRLRSLVIRRNSDDLSDWIERAKWMYRPFGGEAVGKPAEFRFPSGAVFKTGHLKDEDAYTKYQGHEYQRMLIEELTQIPSEERYMKLVASCRSTVDGLKPQVFNTTNPDGPGHKWVKRRFISPALPGTPFKDAISGRSRIFIPARVKDNPVLMEKDPDYIKFLESLPEELRAAWLEGSWEIVEVRGAYYWQWIFQASKQGRIGSVPADPSAQVHTAWDLGMDDSTSIIFYQKIGKEFRLIDYYEENGVGLNHYAQILQEKSRKDKYIYGSHYAPHDIEVREMSSGRSRRDVARDLGISFILVPRVRAKEDGIEAVRNTLPFCWIDSVRCEQLISCLENYRKQYDEKLDIYREQPVHDWSSHGADAMQTLALAMQQMQKAAKPKRKSRSRRYSEYGGYGG
jgi:hypothetical protein